MGLFYMFFKKVFIFYPLLDKSVFFKYIFLKDFQYEKLEQVISFSKNKIFNLEYRSLSVKNKSIIKFDSETTK